MKKPIQLPVNCSATYVEEFLSKETATKLYKLLISKYNIAEQTLKITVNDKVSHLETRKIMFVDEELYSENTFPEEIWGKTAIWPDELREIKEQVETFTGISFSTCVCIYYPDGNYGVTYHSDFPAFGDTTTIPSLSIGEERIFCLREKESLQVHDILLQEGSMFIMGENCQERYEHSLPTNPVYTKGRINLTFRQYGYQNT
ncbi:alpha-ketoglutarate-dependent dioxygenase AlkB [Kordia sp.]|uniref:alpha-ketoglutarate-dependent dioxygenase AlkB n=1 Tax=Kordia sp. TaxID=1965332 RepID=UPI003B5B4AD9